MGCTRTKLLLKVLNDGVRNNIETQVELRMLEVEATHRRHEQRFDGLGDIHWSEDERATPGLTTRRRTSVIQHQVDDSPGSNESPLWRRTSHVFSFMGGGKVAPDPSPGSSQLGSSPVGGADRASPQLESSLSLASNTSLDEEESIHMQILEIYKLTKLAMWNFMSEPDSSTCAPRPPPNPKATHWADWRSQTARIPQP